MRYTIGMLVALLLLTACTTPHSPAAPSAAAPSSGVACPVEDTAEHQVVTWLQGRSSSDVEALRTALQGARVVALGEATHGTHEFLAEQARLTRLLVEEMGFTVVAFETGAAAARPLSAALAAGGDLAEPLRSLGWWWNTEEVYGLLAGLKGRRVHIAGYDMEAPGLAGPLLPPDLAERLADIAGQPPEVQEALQRELEALAAAAAPEEARLLRGVAQYVDVDLLSRNFPEAVAKRERYQAENIQALHHLYGPEARIVVWGGASHFQTTDVRAGSYLRSTYGSEYYALGMLFGEGSVHAIGADRKLNAFQLGRVPTLHFVEWYLGCGGERPYYVDLRHGEKPAPVLEWLKQPLYVRYVSAVFQPGVKDAVQLRIQPSDFDGLYYVPAGTPSHVRP